MTDISETLGKHYAKLFAEYGPNCNGVDWGAEEKNLFLRYEIMLNLLDSNCRNKPSLLDVGCGYGGLSDYARGKGVDVDYTGIDVAGNMIEWAVKNMPNDQFLHGDIMDSQISASYDYVICNGILTQKLEIPGLQMDEFCNLLIKKLYSYCNVGIAFNVMTSKVNYFSNNLYYRNPAEMLSWCLSEISTKIKIDHSYPLFEYTVYIYRDDRVRNDNAIL